MNEKHYDNLCEIARRVGSEGAEMMAAVSVHAFSGSDSGDREESVRCIASLYNALDVLCIALNCEDEVQDMTESIVDELLAAARNPLKS